MISQLCSSPERTPVRSFVKLLVLSFFGVCTILGLGAELQAQTAHFIGAMNDVGGTVAFPSGMARDSAGNLYIADSNNNRVLRVPATDLSCSTPSDCTTVGTGLLNPKGVALDLAGNVLIADTGNNRVLKVLASDLTCSTPSDCTAVGGAALSSPSAVAVDSTGNLYIADTGNNQVWGVSSTDLTCSNPSSCGAVGGAVSAPQGVALNNSNDLLIADTGNSRVVHVPSYDIFCGTPTNCTALTTGQSNPRSVAFDAVGNLYISNSGASTVVEVQNSDWTCATAGDCRVLGAGFNNPGGLAADGQGNVYVADTNNSRAVKLQFLAGAFGNVNVGSAGGSTTLYFQFDTTGSLNATTPYQVTTQGSASLDFANAGTGNCTSPGTYNPGDICSVAVSFTPTASGIRSGAAVLFGSTGTPIATGYVYGNGVGSQVTFLPGVQSAIDTGDASFNPFGVAVDSKGNVFAASYTQGTVVKFTPAGGSYTKTVVVSGLTTPKGVAIDGAGNLFIAASGGVFEATLSGGTYTLGSAIAATGSTLDGVTLDRFGNFYFTDFYGAAIHKYTLYEGAYTASGTTFLSGGEGPTGVVVDLADNIYVSNYNTGTIYKFNASTGYSRSTIVSGLTGPEAIAVDASGALYVTNSGTNEIYKETPNGSSYTQSVLATGVTPQPWWIALDGSGNVYFTSCHGPDTCSGTDGAYTISLAGSPAPTALSFASTAVGATSSDSPQQLAIWNVGNAQLTFSAVTYPTDFPENTSGTSLCSTSTAIALGGSCNVSVNFSPLSSGSLSESVSLKDNALNVTNATQTISVSGTGAGASITLSPGTLTNGTVDVAYSQSISATGGTGPYTYAVTSGSLPAGLTLSTAGALTGTPTAAGSFSFTVTATDSVSATGSQAFTLLVNKGTPTITWATPAAITYGTALSATQLDASSTVAGTFVYTPASGTVLGAGTQTLSVTLTPTDTTDYNTATQTVQLTVNKATPTITWATPANITYGTALSATQLDATSTVAGSFVYTPASGTVLNAGTQTLSVTLTPTDSTDYGTATQTVQLIVDKATPTITWATPAAITYGTALSATQLDATSTVAGTFAYTPASGTVLGAGTQTLSVTLTPTDATDYNTATQTVQIVVNKATPTITWATPAAITYGTALSATELDATSTVAGAFVYTPAAGTVLGVGTQTLSVTLTPTDATDYNTATQTVQIVVNKATPTITWATPAAISYGTALSATQLDASSTVAGTFAYTPAAGTVLGVGTQTLSVTLTPTDATDYNSATQTVQIVVNKATPTITWATPAAITYGTALSATQLNASSTVAGTLVYTPAAGTVLGAGTQTLSVTLTPTDTTDYNTATQTVQIVVNKATPTITWATPANITYGTALSATQLDASSTVAGTFVYTPAAGTVLSAGTQTLSVTLTPTDATDYNTATQTVQITVDKAAAPTITWPNPAAITYGTPLSATQLDATSTVPGSFVYTPAAGTVLGVGTQTLSVTLNPTDSTDYNSATQTVQIVVNKATPTVTWATPGAITYGTALSATQLNASSTTAGTFVYTPAAGTVLNAGSQTLSVTFTPTDGTDNNPVTQTVQLTVNQATQTITFNPPASVAFGSGPITLTATGGASGNAVTFSLVSGPATLSGSTLSFTGAGTVVVAADQAGNANYQAAPQVTKSITVTGATLTVSANNATRVYGAANPTFAGSVTGAQNGDTFTETFSTTATATSNVGTYPIVPTASGSNLGSYTVVTQNGVLTITQAGTTTSLSASGSSIQAGQSVTLTATVVSLTSGTPTGSVSFYDGSTLLGSGNLSAGTATYTTTALSSSGSHSITATYSGDTNFTTSSATSSISVAASSPDFSITSSDSGSKSITQGGLAYFKLSVSPLNGGYPAAVSFAATGQPAGSTVTFSPSSIAANGGTQTVWVSIQTAKGVAVENKPSIAPKLAPFALAFFLLPLAAAKRIRRQGKRFGQMLSLVLLLAAMATAAVLTGCGGSVSHGAPQTSNITVTATSGSIQHTVDLTLTVQ